MVIESGPSSERDEAGASPHSEMRGVNFYRPFRYLDDPICWGWMLIYALNRCVLKPHHIGGWLVHGDLNDLLCLPLFLPIILRLQSALGIRRHDLPPTIFEVLHNWVIFSVCFEVVLPRFPGFDTTADPWDCVAYLVGGVTAYVCWNCFLQGRRERIL